MTLLDISDNWVGAGDSSSRLQFVGIFNDSILSGNARIIVNFADDSFWGEELILHFDGEVYTYTRAFPEASTDQQTLGKEIGIFGIETYWYKNDPHLLEVKDSFGNSQTRRVIFHNVISEVDLRSALDAEPASKLEFPYRLTAVLSYSQSWRVELEGIDGSPVKHWEGCGDCIDAVWDGTDISGQLVNASPYQVTMTALESGITILVGFINQLT